MENNNTNNIEQTNQIFMIYRDGELDRASYYRQKAEIILRGVGHVAYKALEGTVNVLDEMLQAAQ